MLRQKAVDSRPLLRGREEGCFPAEGGGETGKNWSSEVQGKGRELLPLLLALESGSEAGSEREKRASNSCRSRSSERDNCDFLI